MYSKTLLLFSFVFVADLLQMVAWGGTDTFLTCLKEITKTDAQDDADNTNIDPAYSTHDAVACVTRDHHYFILPSLINLRVAATVHYLTSYRNDGTCHR